MSTSALKRPPAHTDPLCGTRYRSCGPLGRGGMAEVVLAEHLGLGKLVVVKLLDERFTKDPEMTRRMQIEARSVAALTSPHIVQVNDFGQTATGRTYIVMERLIGNTLGREVKTRGALPFREAIDYVVQVLAGLEAAHAMGIIHRDIKPDNIFLCDATKDTPRTVKILDFGIAKVLDVASDVGRPALPHLVTEAGKTLGTPRMFAPEQALAKPIDARTDVYATGLLLHTLLTGSRPFAHITDEIKLLMATVKERLEPPSTKTEHDVPPALDAAVMRAVEKDPADRFQSAAAFAAELRRIAEEAASPAPVTRATTEELPPVVAGGEARAEEGRCDDPTLQLASEKTPSAGKPTASTENGQQAPASPSHEPVPMDDGSLSAKPPASTGWAAFVALTLLGALISALVLFAAYRGTP